VRRREFILVIPVLASAQGDGSRRAPRPTGRAVRVVAWADGEPRPGEEWKALVETRPARVLGAREPASDLLLLVVLDLTGELSFASAARDALVEEIGKLPPNAWAAVFRSQDGLQVLADPSADRGPAVDAIRNIQVTGRAGLLETVEPAARLCHQLQRKTPVRAAVLYVTDSNIHNYREDYTNPVINPSDARDLSRRFPEGLIKEKTAKVALALGSYDAPVFVVHLALLRDRLNEAYQTGLQQLAEASGGTADFCRGIADIPVAVSRMMTRIVSHWAIEVELPPGTPKAYTVQLAREGMQLVHRSRFTLREGKE
jgi:hypothetical protein